MAEIQAEQELTRKFLIVRGSDVTGRKKPTGYLITLAHALKGYVGTGIFALGYAFLSSGMLLGPFLMVLIALINLHCQHLLIKACVKISDKEAVEVLPTYGEVVQYTFEDSSSQWLQQKSRFSGILTDIFLLMADYGACLVYFIFVSRHISEIAAVHGWKQDYRVILAIVLVPMWLSTYLGNLKFLAPVSMTGNIIIWTGIILVLYYSTQDLPPFSERDLVSHVNRLPMFFGIVLFAFEATIYIIPLRAEMKNTNAFTSAWGVLNVSMIVVLILYMAVGVFTYWKWGEDVEASAFLNLPEQEMLSQAARILISFGVMLSYALFMYAAFEILYPRFQRTWGPFKHPVLMIYIFKTVVVILTYCVANISPNFGAFISLVGALTGSVLCLILPVLLELVMLYGQLTYFIIVKDVLIIAVGIIGALTGTVLAIMDIVEEYIMDKSEK